MAPYLLGSRYAYLDALIDASIRLSMLGTRIHATIRLFTLGTPYPRSDPLIRPGTRLCARLDPPTHVNLRKKKRNARSTTGVQTRHSGIIGWVRYPLDHSGTKIFLAPGPEPTNCSWGEQRRYALDHRGLSVPVQ